jgi:hypothetical protein
MNTRRPKQQGDLLLRPISDAAAAAIIKDTSQRDVSQGEVSGRLVLAEGEHTGHAHTIEAEDEARLIRDGARMLLILERPATVRHQEHHPITLAPGLWEVGRVREVDHVEQITRRVMD